MATQVQFRRGTTAQTATFTGASGEVTVDTSKNTCVVHDGVTIGGYPLLRQDGVNSSLAAGSLSSPSLKFASGSNTGIYSPSSGSISLVGNGIAGITVDAAGNVVMPGNVTVNGSFTIVGVSNFAPINSPTFTGTVTIPAGANIAGYAPINNPTFTGIVNIPAGANIVGYMKTATGFATIPFVYFSGGF